MIEPQRHKGHKEKRGKKKMELDVKVYVEQMALLVDLQLRDEYKDGVVANFERINNIASVVMEFELSDEVEAAPVFEP